MNIKGIISISGRPGLFKVVAQGKNNVIVEALEDKKRFPAYASDKISALEDISIYAESEDKPLKEIYEIIFEKEKGKETISHKESADKQKAYLLEILPDYDQERVYSSDIKKLFQWYNLLHKVGLLDAEEEKDEEETEVKEEKVAKKPAAKGATKKTTTKTDSEDSKESSETGKKATEKKTADKKETKKAAPKKPTAPKTAVLKKTSAKPTTLKKSPSKTGGTSRGK